MNTSLTETDPFSIKPKVSVMEKLRVAGSWIREQLPQVVLRDLVAQAVRTALPELLEHDTPKKYTPDEVMEKVRIRVSRIMQNWDGYIGVRHKY